MVHQMLAVAKSYVRVCLFLFMFMLVSRPDYWSIDVQNGSLFSPPITSTALGDINKRIRKNRREQDSYLTPLQRFLATKGNQKIGGGNTSNADGANDSGTQVKPLNVVMYDLFCCCLNPEHICHQTAKVAVSIIPFLQSIPYDDGLSLLSADDYLRLRLLPMVAIYAKATPSLASSLQVALIINVVLSVASSALSTFGLSGFIPAPLALSGAITAWTNYLQLELRLLQTNSSLNKINQLLVWW
jgi:hypothetical protein